MDLWPRIYVSTPLLYLTHAVPYYVLGDQTWAYGPLKAAYLCFGIYAAARFFGLFVEPRRAWIGSLLLMLTPLHDGATLWFAGQYLTISLGLYLLAYVQAHAGRPVLAVVLALCGSFSSYGSAPIAAGLALIFMLQKRWPQAVWMLGPNVLYATYYWYTSAILGMGTARLPAELDAATLAVSFAAQFATFIDAGVGPSAWLKYALGLSSLTWMSAVVALAAGVWIWHGTREASTSDTPVTGHHVLLAGCGAIALAAFGVFALTGAYPQVAFSLGNRVAIFGNLFVAAAAMSWLRPKMLAALGVLTVAAFLGISDHWRTWNGILEASRADVRRLELPVDPDTPVFVRGLQYSSLGRVAHIDHFTATYVVRDFFALARGGATLRPASFNARLRIEDTALVDIKYGVRTPVGEAIVLYDAERRTLMRIPRPEIEDRLGEERIELRHWTQLLGPGLIRDLIVRVMPHLRYAYGG